MAWITTYASPAELAAIYTIEQASFATPWSWEMLAAEFAQPKARFRLARYRDPLGQRHEEIVGFCLSWVVLDELHLLQIAVAPPFRRRGLGRLLLHDAIDLAAAERVERIYLEVRASNEAAIGMYEACHFDPIGRRRNYYRNPTEDALVFVHRIPASALIARTPARVHSR